MTTDTTTTSSAKPTRAARAMATAAAAPKPASAAAPILAPVAPPTAPKPTSKSDTVIKLLLRTKGATPTELIAATDWQPHSLRAFLSGLRKKGRSIIREERKGGGFAYRIVVATGEPNDGSTGADAGTRVAAAGDGTAVTPTGPGVADEGRAADGADEA